MIAYTGLEAVKDIVIKCDNWRNPVRPLVYSGFEIRILDMLGRPADAGSDPFSIDATAFTPFEIQDSSIYLALTDNLTRKASDYTFTIKSEVPIQTGKACQVTLRLPEDLDIR